MLTDSAPWYKQAYRRSVVDMHIPDWDDKFLSEFDPKTYVKLLKLASFQSAVVYAQSPLGLLNYPTRVGAMHRGLKGRNVFGEMIDLCHQNGIKIVAYCCLINDRWAYDHHPEWRIILTNGEEERCNLRSPLILNDRNGLCCPNSPGYRQYVAQMANEICTNFEIDGIRFDMTLWPAVCYCANCQARFFKETGRGLPITIDWSDAAWVSFQRKREEWLVDFVEIATRAARQARPGVSVEHQSSTYLYDWQLGVTEALASQGDFLQGDFYGGVLQGIVVRKLLYNLTENPLYGFETSICAFLEQHTTLKPVELLSAKAHAAIADNGAMVFIDGIDPVGTLNPLVYQKLGQVFEKTKAYDPYRGGSMQQDVGVYLSTISKFDPADNGKAPNDPTLTERFPKIKHLPHIDSLTNACQSLVSNHIPFGVITRKDLNRLAGYKIIILPNILMMTEEEAEAFRNFVANGGCLYACRITSLVDQLGFKQRNFLLGDVFGVTYLGETVEQYSYVRPCDNWEHLLPDYSEKYPLGLWENQILVRANDDAQILAKITLPSSDPRETNRFYSLHSNPPGIPTEHPAIVMNRFGNGKAIYATAALENAVVQGVLIHLLQLFQVPFKFEADAPASVEVTLFHQIDEKRYVINLLNNQEELPVIPVRGIQVRLRLEGIRPDRLVSIPDGAEFAFQQQDGLIEFGVPELQEFRMFLLEYQE